MQEGICILLYISVIVTTFDKKSGGTTFLVALYKGMSFGVGTTTWKITLKVLILESLKLRFDYLPCGTVQGNVIWGRYYHMENNSKSSIL